MDSEVSIFQVLEGVVYYVGLTLSSNAMNAFVGSKERVRIPLSGKHSSLQAFVRHAVEHVGLMRQEAEKQGFSSSSSYKIMLLRKKSGW